MKALFTGQSPATGRQRINPTIFTGTSIGAVNASLLVAEPDEDAAKALRGVEEFWFQELVGRQQKEGMELFRLRGDPTILLQPQQFLKRPVDTALQYGRDAVHYAADFLKRLGAFASMDQPVVERPLYLASISSLIDTSGFLELLRETVEGDRIAKSKKSLGIVATNWQTGKTSIFKKEDFTDRDGYRLVAASAAVPGLFPPVAVAGEPFVDGGVLMNTPLKPAIDFKASTLHVIDMTPPLSDMPLVTNELYVLQSLLAIMERILVIGTESRLDKDIARSAWINLGLKRGLSEIEGVRRLLTVHRYHPSRPLGGFLDILNLQARQVEDWINLGFEDAIGHDCERQRCVRPWRDYDIVRINPAGAFVSFFGEVEESRVDRTFFPRDGARKFRFRVTAALPTMALEEPTEVNVSTQDPRELLRQLRFRLNCYDVSNKSAIEPESVEIINPRAKPGLAPDLSPDERIYSVVFGVKNVPDRFVLEVLSPEGKVLTYFYHKPQLEQIPVL